MDKLAQYRTIIKSVLEHYVELLNRRPVKGLETDVVFDEDRDHYLLYNTGWTKQGHETGATVYVRIRNGKFWIEEDWTEEGIATHLLEAGVPNEDIVLAFQPPEMRPHTEFAIA